MVQQYGAMVWCDSVVQQCVILRLYAGQWEEDFMCVILCSIVLQYVTLSETVCFTVTLYKHSGRRIWAVDTKVISRQCQHPELSPEIIKTSILLLLMT